MWVHGCVDVRVEVCMCLDLQKMYVCVRLDACVCVSGCVFIDVNMCLWMCVWRCVCMYMCMCLWMCVHVCASASGAQKRDLQREWHRPTEFSIWGDDLEREEHCPALTHADLQHSKPTGGSEAYGEGEWGPRAAQQQEHETLNLKVVT